MQTPADILLVEDNEGDALLTTDALESAIESLTVHRVRDGVEALRYLRREGEFAHCARPDLILLDLNMPRMDGREVLKSVKADHDLNSIPVVVLTTSQADRDVAESYELQASCFVTKPIEYAQFTGMVQRLVDFWFEVVRLPPAQRY